MTTKINISFIIEILGRPKEHVEKTLKQLIDKLGEEKGMNLLESNFHEPKLFEKIEGLSEEQLKDMKERLKDVKNMGVENKLFTSFAEVEAELDDLNTLMVLAFNYMPSNIDITSPENFFLKNADISAILTNVILRLHRYDELVKKVSVEKSLMEDKLKEVLGEKKN